jgi:hypothetical protein
VDRLAIMAPARAAATRALGAAVVAAITVVVVAAVPVPPAFRSPNAGWEVVVAAVRRSSNRALRTSRTAGERHAKVTARLLFAGLATSKGPQFLSAMMTGAWRPKRGAFIL